jgi:hypothetical protein
VGLLCPEYKQHLASAVRLLAVVGLGPLCAGAPGVVLQVELWIITVALIALGWWGSLVTSDGADRSWPVVRRANAFQIGGEGLFAVLEFFCGFEVFSVLDGLPVGLL